MRASRKLQKRNAMIDDIKQTARKLMQVEGTTGLTIRAIAREMDMTSAALYYYVTSIEELLTMLILDAFDDLSEAQQATNDQLRLSGAGYIDQLIGLGTTYREWALSHPVDFQLIYGNPIPGYEQPIDITYPSARRSFALLAKIVDSAITAGEIQPDYPDLPRVLIERFEELAKLEGHDYPPLVLAISASFWSKFHGIIMLELFNLIQPVVGDVGAFYRYELDHLVTRLTTN